MKITPNTLRTGLVADTVSYRPSSGACDPDRASGAGDARPRGAAKVALSPTACALAPLADGSGDVDMARVAAIRDAIAACNLKIDTSCIADGLISCARDLLK